MTHINLRHAADQGTIWTLVEPEPAPPDPTLSDRLLILACSATKRPGAEPMPAIDRYQGPLWQTLRVADPDGARCQVAFVSAYYGGPWCARSSLIANYDARLTDAQAIAWIATGRRPMGWDRHPNTRERKALRGGRCLHQMETAAAPARRFREVCLVGGATYLGVMRAQVHEARRFGNLAGAVVTEINGQIGQMRHDLRQWIA